VLTPFPGTPLYERLGREGRLLEPGAWEKCTLFDVLYRPSHMSVEQLRTGMLGLAKKVYCKEVVEARQRQFVRRKMERDIRLAG
jgi:radical SAM superfamily enzyme YgiQ (UPF0313 family)